MRIIYAVMLWFKYIEKRGKIKGKICKMPVRLVTVTGDSSSPTCLKNLSVFIDRKKWIWLYLKKR